MSPPNTAVPPESNETDPIDIVESLAEFRDWEFDRVGEDQIAMTVEGQWHTYSITLAWSAHDETLRLICTFEMRQPKKRQARIAEIINLANEKIWQGCFYPWREENLIVYRYGLTLAGGATATAGQVDAMVRAALGACERFYPAFQLVAFSGETAEQALSIAMTEAYGRA